MNHLDNPESLIEATELRPNAIDRRRTAGNSYLRWFSDRRRRERVNVGLEISPGGISLAIIAGAGTGSPRLTTDFAALPSSAMSQWTLESLSTLLKQLTAKYELQGHSVFVALGGNACVTRSFVGNNDDVDVNCKELAERAIHYLALGRGEKVCCQAETALDVRRKRAWVTVGQRDVIELVAKAVENAGLRLAKIEHTLTALCQVAGHSGCDQQEPILMVLTAAGRSDMFISFQGGLLLDYRPTQRNTTQDRSTIWHTSVIKHIKCLRRYLASQLPRGQASLSKICLPATNWTPNAEQVSLLEANDLQLTGLSIDFVCSGLEQTQATSQGELATAQMMAAIWMSRSMMEQAENATPSDKSTPGDLTSSLRQHIDWSLRTLSKNLWPIAASLLLIVGLYGTLLQKRSQLQASESQLDGLQSVRLELDRLNLQMKRADDLVKVAGQLQQKLRLPDADLAIKMLGRSLPKGAWLKLIEVDGRRNVTVVGVCYTEDGIYEYLQALKQMEALRNVALVSTRPNRLPTGPAFEFELKASVNPTDVKVQPAPARNQVAM
jgi:Fimbrial assembly protein (PilN)